MLHRALPYLHGGSLKIALADPIIMCNISFRQFMLGVKCRLVKNFYSVKYTESKLRGGGVIFRAKTEKNQFINV